MADDLDPFLHGRPTPQPDGGFVPSGITIADGGEIRWEYGPQAVGVTLPLGETYPWRIVFGDGRRGWPRHFDLLPGAALARRTLHRVSREGNRLLYTWRTWREY